MSASSPLGAARLVVWGNAYLLGGASLDQAGERAADPAGAPRVHGLPGGPASLTVALGLLAQAGSRGFRLSLPVPGDVSGLPGPAAFNAAALAAGEAALCQGVALGLVPTTAEPGPTVDWHLLETTANEPAMPGLADADRSLAAAIREATGALEALDVAGADPAVVDDLERIRGRGGSIRLPEAYPPRAQVLLDQAVRIQAILEIAARQEGAAHSAGAMSARRYELTQLAAAARQAVVASCNAVVETSVAGPASR